jgi:hypothetical protein
MDNAPKTETLIRQNKRLKISLIISLVLLVLSVSFIGIIVVINLLEKAQDAQPIGPQEVTEIPETVDKDSEFLIAETTDVSEYTDISLQNYDGLGVNIFKGFDHSFGLEEDDLDSFVPGIVSYFPLDWAESDKTYDEKYSLFGPEMTMDIVSSNSISNDQQQKLFDISKKAIEQKDLDARDLDIGHLPVFRTYIAGSARHDVVKQIEGIDYENSDDSFTVLFIGGYQDGPFLDIDKIGGVGTTFKISVFAIKDDNLITLTGYYNNTANLGVSEEDHMDCVVYDEEAYPLEYNPEYEGTFDTSCLVEVLQDEKYDNEITDLAEDLVGRFALAN